MSIKANILISIALGLAVSSQVSAEDKQMPPPPPEFSSVDLNSDKSISVEEFSKQQLPPGMEADAMFSQMDSNSDGSVSEEEFANFKPGPPQQ